MQQNSKRNMQTINLQGLIEAKGLNKNELAQQLFPDHKYPNLALSRVLKGEGHLDAGQISLLSLLTDTPIIELFSGAHWAASTQGRTHTLISGEFKAEINLDTHVTKIFHSNSLFHESVLHSEMIPLSTFISMVDAIITSYISKGKKSA